MLSIKYRSMPVQPLVAKAEVIRREHDKYVIWVKVRNNNEEVFRAKFIIVSLPNERIEK